MSHPDTSDRHPGIYVALVPWVLFSVVCRISVDAASLLALIAATAIATPAIRARHPKILELAAVASFAAFTLTVLIIDPGAADTLHRYARAIAAGLLAVIALGSLLFTPFTEQYARESLPQQLCNTPQFKATNRTITALWGAAFAAMVPCHLIAAHLDTTRSNLIFNWILPLLLASWALKHSTNPPHTPTTTAHA